MPRILIIVLLFFILITGCTEKKEKGTIGVKEISDTVSLYIKYDISGAGQGSISMTKFRDNIRLDLEKLSGGEVVKESRFISDGYIHYYISVNGALQPVKTRIVKDHNYQKGFAAFTDAGEFVPRMKKSGSEIISGNICDIYKDTDGSEYSVFGGMYVLRALFGGNLITANTFILNRQIDSTYVKPPEGIIFEDISQ